MNTKKQYAYKVVRVVNNKLLSARIIEDDLVVEYKINQFVSAILPNSYLFVFKTLQDAKNFIRGGNDSIYLAEVKGVHRSIVLTTWYNVVKIWKKRHSKKRFRHLLGMIPQGTLMVDQVRLIRPYDPQFDL